MKSYYLITLVLALSVTACSDSDSTESKNIPNAKDNESKLASGSSEDKSSKNRMMNFSQIARGGKIFQQNCISCHGAKAEGQPNWTKTDNNGKYPAPPLNGTGHAWHHSNAVNTNTIKNGTIHLGGSMPAWKDKLTDQEISDVIAWFQSKWSDKVYWTWYEKVENSKYK